MVDDAGVEDERGRPAGGQPPPAPGGPDGVVLEIRGSFARWRRFALRRAAIGGVVSLAVLVGGAWLSSHSALTAALVAAIAVVALGIGAGVSAAYIASARLEVTRTRIRYRRWRRVREIGRAGGVEAYLERDQLGRPIVQLLLREHGVPDRVISVYSIYFDDADLGRLLELAVDRALTAHEWAAPYERARVSRPPRRRHPVVRVVVWSIVGLVAAFIVLVVVLNILFP